MSAQMQPVTDPTRGMNLVSNANPDREVTRYLFTAGQFLDPDRVFQVEHLRDAGGGEEVQTHCFRRTVGGFLPRGRLTPMETWVDHLPSALIGEGLEDSTVHIVGPTSPESLGMSRRRGALIGKPLSNVRFYPGDEILSVLRANQGRGLVEVKALKGVAWYEDEAETRPGVPQILNRDFFSGRVPPTLNGLREAIDKVAGRSALHAAVAGDKFISCDQFERYAQTVLAAEHTLLRQRVSHQHTHTYSPIAREYLRQLEMQPQDNILEQMSSGINAAQLGEILAKFGGGGQMSPEMVGRIAGEVARQMMAAQASTSDTEASDTAPEQGEPLPILFDTNAPSRGTVIRVNDEGVAEGQPVPRRKKNTEA